MRFLEGDISGPVLAIIVTITIIIAGLTLLGWFWYFSQQAGKVGIIQIMGTPALLPNETSSEISQYTLFILVRNIGNEPVRMLLIVVEGAPCTMIDGNNIVPPGEFKEITAVCEYTINLRDKKVLKGTLFTDYGTYTFNAIIL